MANFDDNARGFDMESESNDSRMVEQTDCDGVHSAKLEKLMQEFAELSLKVMDAESNRIRKATIDSENAVGEALREKMQLLNHLTVQPVDTMYAASKCTTVKQIEQAHLELLGKFRNLFRSEDEYMSAYAKHCADAIKSKMALKDAEKYDEFTEMPRDLLQEKMEQLTVQTLSVKTTCEAMRANQLLKQKEYEAQYAAKVKELEMFQQYEGEMLDTLEMLKFEADKKKPREQ